MAVAAVAPPPPPPPPPQDTQLDDYGHDFIELARVFEDLRCSMSKVQARLAADRRSLLAERAALAVERDRAAAEADRAERLVRATEHAVAAFGASKASLEPGTDAKAPVPDASEKRAPSPPPPPPPPPMPVHAPPHVVATPAPPPPPAPTSVVARPESSSAKYKVPPVVPQHSNTPDVPAASVPSCESKAKSRVVKAPPTSPPRQAPAVQQPEVANERIVSTDETSHALNGTAREVVDATEASTDAFDADLDGDDTEIRWMNHVEGPPSKSPPTESPFFRVMPPPAPVSQTDGLDLLPPPRVESAASATPAAAPTGTTKSRYKAPPTEFNGAGKNAGFTLHGSRPGTANATSAAPPDSNQDAEAPVCGVEAAPVNGKPAAEQGEPAQLVASPRPSSGRSAPPPNKVKAPPVRR